MSTAKHYRIQIRLKILPIPPDTLLWHFIPDFSPMPDGMTACFDVKLKFKIFF